MESEKNPVDILGLAPYGEAINTAVEKTGDIAKLAVEKSFETAAKFYNDLCQPAAAEAGLLFRDKLREYRAKTLAAIAGHARQYLEVTNEGLQLKAPPRLIAAIMESGSWCDDEGLQKMWAGLLASSLTPDGKEDSNVMFLETLKGMTSAQAKFIEYVCLHCEKALDKAGEVVAYAFALPYSETQEILGCANSSDVKANLGHLRALGLLTGAGLTFLEIELKDGEKTLNAPNLTPDTLGLQFYVRCQGSRKSLKDFFKVTEPYDRKNDNGQRRLVYVVKGD
jgi:hypothetical protein